MKQRTKNAIGGITAVIAVVAIIGGIGALSGWNITEWIQSSEMSQGGTKTHAGLVTVDLRNENSGMSLPAETLVAFLNESIGNHEPIFTEVVYVEDGTGSELGGRTYLMNAMYKDNGGLRFGDGSQLGYFTVNLSETYSFNQVKITGRNYSVFNKEALIYSCDESAVTVNGAEKQTFRTNAEDPGQIAPTEDKFFSFPDMQNQLSIRVSGKRATIFEIQLWTESEIAF